MTHTALPVNHRAKMCSKPLLVVFVALLALRNAYGTREVRLRIRSPAVILLHGLLLHQPVSFDKTLLL